MRLRQFPSCERLVRKNDRCQVTSNSRVLIVMHGATRGHAFEQVSQRFPGIVKSTQPRSFTLRFSVFHPGVLFR